MNLNLSDCGRRLLEEYISDAAFRLIMHDDPERAMDLWDETHSDCRLTPGDRAAIRQGHRRYKDLTADEVAALAQGKEAMERQRPMGFVFW